MTLLTSNDIENVGRKLGAYDSELRRKTGRSLLGIACHAAGMEVSAARKHLSGLRLAVIPMTGGRGIITGFADTVCQICTHLGCNGYVTARADVAGIAESMDKNPDMIMMADDERFIAIDIKRGRAIDNAVATGRGFAAGLDLMAEGVGEKPVLVIGCGPVGRNAAGALLEFGARVSIFDIVARRCTRWVQSLDRAARQRLTAVPDLQLALKRHPLIVEASNAPNTIRAADLVEQTCIAAPGMPLGLDTGSRSRPAFRVLHDPLQIGVATMLLLAVAGAYPARTNNR